MILKVLMSIIMMVSLQSGKNQIIAESNNWTRSLKLIIGQADQFTLNWKIKASWLCLRKRYLARGLKGNNETAWKIVVFFLVNLGLLPKR